MKKLFFLMIASGLITMSAHAIENQNDDTLFDQYAKAGVAIQNSGWDYLGCATSKERCGERATERGYSESKLVYLSCGGHNSFAYSCFAR